MRTFLILIAFVTALWEPVTTFAQTRRPVVEFAQGDTAHSDEESTQAITQELQQWLREVLPLHLSSENLVPPGPNLIPLQNAPEEEQTQIRAVAEDLEAASAFALRNADTEPVQTAHVVLQLSEVYRDLNVTEPSQRTNLVTAILHHPLSLAEPDSPTEPIEQAIRNVLPLEQTHPDPSNRLAQALINFHNEKERQLESLTIEVERLSQLRQETLSLDPEDPADEARIREIAREELGDEQIHLSLADLLLLEDQTLSHRRSHTARRRGKISGQKLASIEILASIPSDHVGEFLVENGIARATVGGGSYFPGYQEVLDHLELFLNNPALPAERKDRWIQRLATAWPSFYRNETDWVFARLFSKLGAAGGRGLLTLMRIRSNIDTSYHNFEGHFRKILEDDPSFAQGLVESLNEIALEKDRDQILELINNLQPDILIAALQSPETEADLQAEFENVINWVSNQIESGDLVSLLPYMHDPYIALAGEAVVNRLEPKDWEEILGMSQPGVGPSATVGR